MNRSLILDLVVASTILIATFRGWKRRSIREAFSLLGLAGGLVLIMVATGPASAFVRAVSSVSDGASRALAMAILFVVCIVAGAIAGYRISKKVPVPAPRRLDASGGAAFALVRILMLVALGLMTLDIAWGQQSVGHRMIADSVSGEVLISDESPFGMFYGALVDRSHDLQAIESWAQRRDPTPVGYKQTELQATDANLTLRPDAEQEMLDSVNDERAQSGLEPLDWCAECARVARSHSRDMYRGGYFSHEDLEGLDPFERMTEAGIPFGAAGENLALAPTVAEAHTGLMKSPDHRANILRADFDQVGIGIYDGPYGLMCTQVFRATP